MAATKLSALTSATSLAGSDLIYVVEGAVSKSITKDVFISQFNVEKRTSDYAANADNVGKIWARTDTGEIKTVTDNGGTYAVDQLNRFTAADETKLDGIEAGAEVNPTDAETKTAYENNADTNAFTDAEQTKLTGIEANATQYALAESRTTDYSADASNVGRVWLRTEGADGDIKAVLERTEPASSGWTSGGAINTGRSYGAGFGASNSDCGFATGKTSNLASAAITSTETYDGTTWTDASAAVSTGRSAMASSGGTTSAAYFSGGENSSSTRLSSTEEFDGTSWSAGGNDVVARKLHSGGGLQTDAISFGGDSGASPNNAINTMSTYNGTSWTSGTAMPADRWGPAGDASSSSDAMAVNGANDSNTRQTSANSWNGTSWTTENSLTEDTIYSMGIGNSSNFLRAGGYDGAEMSGTETFDGTNWSAGTAMSTTRRNNMDGGSYASGFIAGGFTNASWSATTSEEWAGGIAFAAYSVDSLKYGKIEGLTADLTANAANSGRVWMRTDDTTPTIKAVVAYDDGAGNEIYAVRTFTTT